MATDLNKYFENRFGKSDTHQTKSGPFITISRQTGCNGTGIARDLMKELKNYHLNWKFINKEILEDSANKLKLDPSKIKYVFETKKRTHADEVISALSSKYYKSDKIVRKTITQVLKHYATDGHIIMVGRAGVATTSDIPGGLHLRLVAPYSWRLSALKRRKAFENIDAKKFVKQHDLKKQQLVLDFCGKSINDIYFDLTINCASYSRQQLIDIIIQSLKMKNMI